MFIFCVIFNPTLCHTVFLALSYSKIAAVTVRFGSKRKVQTTEHIFTFY